MNVSSATSGLTARVDTANQASVAVAKMALDQAKSQGAAANEMIQAAAQVQKNAIKGGGSGVDTYA